MSYPVILLRTVLAVVFGGMIGMERESKHRPAGFRTHTLVSVGASTIMILSELLSAKFEAQYGVLPDPARMGAQVISGIGFLGAGTIMRYGTNVRGLTTAASIWATGCIGLATGAGFYSLAGTMAVVILITLITFNRLSHYFDRRAVVRDVLVELCDEEQALGAATRFLMQNTAKIISVAPAGRNDASGDVRHMTRVIFIVQFASWEHVSPCVLLLSEIEGISRAEVL